MRLDIFEIISVDNEFINGKTLNTNPHWLVKMMTKLGGFAKRYTVVRDDVDDISSAFRIPIGMRAIFKGSVIL